MADEVFNRLSEAVGEAIAATKSTVLDDLTPPDLDNYLKVTHELANNDVLLDIFDKAATPHLQFIAEEAKTMEEVFAHRAVLVAINGLKKLLADFAAEYDEKAERGAVSSDIAPQPE